MVCERGAADETVSRRRERRGDRTPLIGSRPGKASASAGCAERRPAQTIAMAIERLPTPNDRLLAARAAAPDSLQRRSAPFIVWAPWGRSCA